MTACNNKTTYLIHMFTTGRLPNTTPATQKAKQAVAMTINCGFLVENGPIERCTQRTAEKEKVEKKNLQKEYLPVPHLKIIYLLSRKLELFAEI